MEADLTRAAEKIRREGSGYAAWAGSWRAVLLLVLAVTAARLVYLAWFCPYTLLEDEAHYWEWSRHLAWSYYSKGPGVAWLIAMSTAVFGDTEFAVRLPAALSSAVAALALAGLARDASGDKRAGFFAAAVFQLVPMFQSTSLMMTIDMPYAACWSLAAWWCWRGWMMGRIECFVAAGLAVAAGVAFKHTMLLFLPGAVVFAVLAARNGGRANWMGVATVLVLSLVGLVPNVIWNAQHDWATVKHLMGHLGMVGGDVPQASAEPKRGWDPMWTVEFIGTQIALAGPMLLLAFAGLREGVKQVIARRYLLAIAAPILLFYVGVSFVTEPEGNWALAGYTTLTALAGWGVVEGMDAFVRKVRAWRALPEPRPKAGFLLRRPETFAQVAWHATLVVGVVFGVAALRLDLLAKVPGLGKAIPLSRLMGADEMASHVARLMEEIRRPGEPEPMVISQFYGRASQMAFYLPGHPRVYCSGSRMGGRKSQYDVWTFTDLADPELAGRNAVLLGDAGRSWWWGDANDPDAGGFKRVEPRGKLDGDRKRNREAFVGFEYTPPTPKKLPTATSSPGEDLPAKTP